MEICIMNKKTVKTTKKKQIKSTYDELIEKLSPQEQKEFDEDYKNLLLSELILAAMEQDQVSVRKLAKMAGVSPTIVQSMRTSTKKNYSLDTFYKILKNLGFDQFMVGREGQFINIDLSQFNKK